MNKRLNISTVIEKDVSDPVPVYSTTSMTAAYWFGVVWELSHEKSRFIADKEITRSICDNLAEYLTAIALARWARSADVDIEPELQEKIDSVLAKDLLNTPLPHLQLLANHNAELRMFEDDDDFNDWLGSCLRRAVSTVNRAESEVNANRTLVRMVSEKYPGSRPEFMASGWDTMRSAVNNTIYLPFTVINTNGLWVEMFENVNEHHNWMLGSQVPLTTIEPNDFVRGRLFSNDVSEKDAAEKIAKMGVLIIESTDYYEDFMGLFEMSLVLSKVKAIPKNIEHLLLIGIVPGSTYNVEQMRKAISHLGIPVLFSFEYNDEPRIIEPSELVLSGMFELSSFRTTTTLIADFAWEYIGPLSDDASFEADALLTLTVLNKLVSKMKETFNVHIPSEDDDGYTFSMPPDDAIDVAHALSFGTMDFEKIRKTARDFTENRERLTSNVLSRIANYRLKSGDESFVFTNKARFLVKAYEMMGIFPDNLLPYFGLEIEQMSVSDGVSVSKEKAFEVGIDTMLQAFARGVPVEDIMCGFAQT